jgi:predicted TIM-barrel fold metal-dependent hydrolase
MSTGANRGRIWMLTRRNVLIGAAVTGAAALARPVTSALAAASQPSTQVNFAVPNGTCDCHTHIFGDPHRFPFAASRIYTPELASIKETRALHRALHVDRIVIVHPTVYGTDNSCTIDAVQQLAPNARGIAVIDDNTPDSALDDMNQAGVRGIRINLETLGQSDPAVARQRFLAAVGRIKKRANWHLEVYTRLSVIETMVDLVAAAPVPVVFDHFGGAKASLGVQQPGFDTLLMLVQTGRAYVKVSAAYRSSSKAPNYSDVAPLAKALIAANPRRILWGSDWPHPAQIPRRRPTVITPLFQIDDGNVFNQFALWAPDATHRQTILVDNPAKLYDF